MLVHTKGRWARQAFVLEGFQDDEIIRPLAGEVIWSTEWRCYVRRYRLAYIVMGRKNGKSEIVAGVVLLLLVGDDETEAEVYGAARDTQQAGKVGQVVVRMRQLSPDLLARLGYNKNSRRVYDDQTGSYFEVIAADALGELGHNPHGWYIDEVLSQRDGTLYTALRTAAGARHQPLGLLVTTETNDPMGFGAAEIDEAERIQEDPARAPHVFAYVRKLPKNADELARLHRIFPGHPDLPVSTDPFDERNWKWPNPALDLFLSRQTLRDEALEAKNKPTELASFRQFRMSQRVSKASRFVPMDLWRRCYTEVWPTPQWRIDTLAGQPCWAGLDLSATVDLTSWCLLFADGTAWWRHWTTEEMLPKLDAWTTGRASQWAEAGWLTVCEGGEVDYDRVVEDIVTDAGRFRIRRVSYDRWSMPPLRQQVAKKAKLRMVDLSTTYDAMTAPLQELTRVLVASELDHLGNPLVEWMAASLEVRRDGDRMRPVKPDRDKAQVRIDGMVTLLNALDGQMRTAGKDRRAIRGRSVG